VPPPLCPMAPVVPPNRTSRSVSPSEDRPTEAEGAAASVSEDLEEQPRVGCSPFFCGSASHTLHTSHWLIDSLQLECPVRLTKDATHWGMMAETIVGSLEQLWKVHFQHNILATGSLDPPSDLPSRRHRDFQDFGNWLEEEPRDDLASKQEEDEEEDGSTQWMVIGGARSGGIVVRSGPSMQSQELGRLSPGTMISIDVSILGKAHFLASEGDNGPREGWVNMRMAGKPLLSRMEGSAAKSVAERTRRARPPPEDRSRSKRTRWVVVGGVNAQGIVVRSASSEGEVLGRLSHGAIIEERDQAKDRISFVKLHGEGPDEGWVSFYAKGAALILPAGTHQLDIEDGEKPSPNSPEPSSRRVGSPDRILLTPSQTPPRAASPAAEAVANTPGARFSPSSSWRREPPGSASSPRPRSPEIYEVPWTGESRTQSGPEAWLAAHNGVLSEDVPPGLGMAESEDASWICGTPQRRQGPRQTSLLEERRSRGRSSSRNASPVVKTQLATPMSPPEKAKASSPPSSPSEIKRTLSAPMWAGAEASAAKATPSKIKQGPLTWRKIKEILGGQAGCADNGHGAAPTLAPRRTED